MKYQTTLTDNTPIAITIGNFDGVHRGHIALFHKLTEMAQVLDCTPVIVTFSPHTLAVIQPKKELKTLTTLEEKLSLAQRYGGIDHTIVISFTPEVAALTAQEFLDTLRTHFSLRGLIVGENFSLGHKRQGDLTFLKAYGQTHQIQVHGLTLQEVDQQRISSTRIRNLVSAGEIATANHLLGHPMIVSGPVQEGDKRGRQIGFPTANLRPDPTKLLPADGVYAVRVFVPDGLQSDSYPISTVYNGVANIGVRPTFNGQERLVEAHLLDTTLDLYGTSISIEFITRLRSEQRFSGIEALKKQIYSDIEDARQILPTVRSVSN